MSRPQQKPIILPNEKQSEEKIPQKSHTIGKTANQLMHKHLNDEKDVISEEDFKNLKLDLELPADAAHQPLEITEEKNRPKDEDKDPKMLTPWDIINE
jgi:hypothetical protein